MSKLARLTALAVAALVVATGGYLVLQSRSVPAAAVSAVLGSPPSGAFGPLMAQLKVWKDSFSQGYAIGLRAEKSNAWQVSPDLAALLRSPRPQDVSLTFTADCREGGPVYALDALQVASGLSTEAVRTAWSRSRSVGTFDPGLLEQVVRHATVSESRGDATSVDVTPVKRGALPRLEPFSGAEDARKSLLRAWPEARLQCTDTSVPSLAALARSSGLKLSPTRSPTAADLGYKSWPVKPRGGAVAGWAVVLTAPSARGANAAFDSVAARLEQRASLVQGERRAEEDRVHRRAVWRLSDGELTLALQPSQVKGGRALLEVAFAQAR